MWHTWMMHESWHTYTQKDIVRKGTHTRKNESCHTFELKDVKRRPLKTSSLRARTHMRMSLWRTWIMSESCHILQGTHSHMNESCHTCEWVCDAHEQWVSQVTFLRAHTHSYEWVVSHMWMSLWHTWTMSESGHILKGTHTLIWMSRVTHVNESVTHMNNE